MKPTNQNQAGPKPPIDSFDLDKIIAEQKVQDHRERLAQLKE